MIELHYFPSNASFAPHILLEEMGVPFTLRVVDRANNEHKSPAYLKLNPNGLIPTLVDGDLVLYETAAILMHLADCHPGFAPAPGTAARAEYYKWMVWLTNTLQAMPGELRAQAIERVVQCCASGGTVLVVCRGRDRDDVVEGPPWPISRDELERFTGAGLREISFEDVVDDDGVRRFVEVDELTNPGEQHLHRPNCSRKRRSFS